MSTSVQTTIFTETIAMPECKIKITKNEGADQVKKLETRVATAEQKLTAKITELSVTKEQAAKDAQAAKELTDKMAAAKAKAESDLLKLKQSMTKATKASEAALKKEKNITAWPDLHVRRAAPSGRLLGRIAGRPRTNY